MMNSLEREIDNDLYLIEDYISEHYPHFSRDDHKPLFAKDMASIGLDLDRTVIYSGRSVVLPKGYDRSLKVVEYHNGQPSSYMTDMAYKMLRYLAKSTPVSAVTARTIPQVKRVVLPWGANKNFVCLSGAKVYFDGEESKDWSHYVEEKLSKASLSVLEVANIADKYVAEGFAHESKNIENAFVQLKVNMDFSSDELMENLENDLAGSGFFPSLQGRKAYLSPNSLQKGEAFEHLNDLLGVKGDVFAAGDSKMDLSLLDVAHHKLVPLHGEIVEDGLAPEESFVTSRMGVLAGEEIAARLFLALAR